MKRPRLPEPLVLDEAPESCYTETEQDIPEEVHDKDTFYLPRQYLSQPDGGIYHEGFG